MFEAIILAQFLVQTGPPPEYDYKPRQRTYIHRLSDADTQIMCRNSGRVLACTLSVSPCIIVLGPHGNQNCLLRHEMAHCNGWPSYHPGAVPC